MEKQIDAFEDRNFGCRLCAADGSADPDVVVFIILPTTDRSRWGRVLMMNVEVCGQHLEDLQAQIAA